MSSSELRMSSTNFLVSTESELSWRVFCFPGLFSLSNCDSKDSSSEPSSTFTLRSESSLTCLVRFIFLIKVGGEGGEDGIWGGGGGGARRGGESGDKIISKDRLSFSHLLHLEEQLGVLDLDDVVDLKLIIFEGDVHRAACSP